MEQGEQERHGAFVQVVAHLDLFAELVLLLDVGDRLGRVLAPLDPVRLGELWLPDRGHAVSLALLTFMRADIAAAISGEMLSSCASNLCSSACCVSRIWRDGP